MQPRKTTTGVHSGLREGKTHMRRFDEALDQQKRYCPTYFIDPARTGHEQTGQEVSSSRPGTMPAIVWTTGMHMRCFHDHAQLHKLHMFRLSQQWRQVADRLEGVMIAHANCAWSSGVRLTTPSKNLIVCFIQDSFSTSTPTSRSLPLGFFDSTLPVTS